MNIEQEALKLKAIPLFAMLDSAQLKLLAFTSESLTYSDGEFLMRSGESSEEVMVVLEGSADILDGPDDKPVFIARKGTSALLGEMGVLRNNPRSASIIANGEVTVLRISRERFLELIIQNPQMAIFVMQTLSDKLAQATSELTDLRRQVKDVPAG